MLNIKNKNLTQTKVEHQKNITLPIIIEHKWKTTKHLLVNANDNSKNPKPTKISKNPKCKSK